MVQWLRLCFHCRGAGSIPGPGTKILHAMWHGQKKKERNWWAGFSVQTGERLELMKMDVIRKVPQLARPDCDLLFALGLLVPGSSNHWTCLTEKQINKNEIVLKYLPVLV